VVQHYDWGGYDFIPGLFSVRLARAGDATQTCRDLVRDLYRAAITMPQERVDLLLKALV
jgi:hypothetical protein